MVVSSANQAASPRAAPVITRNGSVPPKLRVAIKPGQRPLTLLASACVAARNGIGDDS
jgi:hypothetical protein